MWLASSAFAKHTLVCKRCSLQVVKALPHAHNTLFATAGGG
jgi:hypothetical protein